MSPRPMCGAMLIMAFASWLFARLAMAQGIGAADAGVGVPGWVEIVGNLGAIGVLIWLVIVQMPKERETFLARISEITQLHREAEVRMRDAFEGHAAHDAEANKSIVNALNQLAVVQGQLLVVLQQQTRWDGVERRSNGRRNHQT